MISNSKSGKHLQTILLLLIPVISLLQPADARTKIEKIYGNGVSYAPGEVLVKFKSAVGNVESSSAVADIYQRSGIVDSEPLFLNNRHRTLVKNSVADLGRILKLRVAPTTDIINLCQQLQQESSVEYAEPNYYSYPCFTTPNDSLFSQQWYLNAIKVPEGWDVSKGDTSVIIAIVDSGIDLDHPDLVDRIWRNRDEIPNNHKDDDLNGYVDDVVGWDFQQKNNDPNPEPDGIDNNKDGYSDETVDHGTSMAGFATATTNNFKGIAGVGWKCKLMALKVFPDEGGASAADISDAIVYASDNGANIINLSLGSSSPSQTERIAIRYAVQAGAAVFAAAGNSNSSDPHYPSAFPEVLAVAGTGSIDDIKSSISNFGPNVDVCAPGGDFNLNPPSEMVSTNYYDPQYGFRNLYGSRTKEGLLQAGTSSSTALVSGLAGLLLAQKPAMTNIDLYFQIAETADNIDNKNPLYAGQLGYGRVNAFRALTETISAKPKIDFVQYAINDSLLGNNNKKLDIGETANIEVTFINQWENANMATITLVINDPEITLINAVSHLGTFYGLRNLSENERTNVEDPFIISVSPNSVPRRFKAKLILSAEGYEKDFDFALPIDPQILVVDDDVPGRDGNNASVENYYYDALDAIDVSYNTWDVNMKGDPRSDSLGQYNTVIWFCEKAAPSLNSSNRAAIENYFKNFAGNLLLFGQDIGWDLNDASGDTNEFIRDSRSKGFYENYLQARYKADNAFSNQVAGVANDPIGDGLAFVIEQPGRSPALQSPDVVDTLNGSVACLTYPDGRPAILHSIKALPGNKNSRIVYFPFGGIEAIVDNNMRQELLVRSLNWLHGVHVTHLALKDLEAPAAREVAANITADTPGVLWDRVELLYTVNAAYPATAVPMTTFGGNVYKATIPEVASGRVDYQIIVKSSDGYYAPRVHYVYNVSADTQAPTVTTLKKLYNTLDKKGPFTISASISDNKGVDANAVYLHYRTKRIPSDSVKAGLGSSANEYAAQITGNFSYGDTLLYYFSAKDIAQTANYATSAEDTAVIGNENFEHGLGGWTSDGKGPWGPSPDDPHDGSFSLADSPNGTPESNLTTTLTLNYPLDLSQADNADLTFWSRNMLRQGKDYGYVEISTDNGTTWLVLTNVTGIKPTWRQLSLPLDSYVGAGFGDILLRFRLQTQSGAIGDNFYGWHIDDIQLHEGVQTEIKSADESVLPPASFGLAQNYPNPFNPTTSIAYQLPSANHVRIEVFNMLGQRIRTLVDEKKEAGRYSILWKGDDESGAAVASGMYFYRMEAGEFVSVRKLLLLK